MKKRCISFIRKSIIAVFCTFTAFSHCLFGYASNDDEYFTFTNIEFVKAYKFFYEYGLEANYSYSYTDTYISTGNISSSASISLSGSGNNNFTGASNNDVLGMIHNFHTEDTTYNVVVNSQQNIGSLQNSAVANTLHLACQYSNYTNGSYENLECTDPNFNDVTNYTITLYQRDGAIQIEGYPSDDYAIFRRATDGDYNYETNSDLHLEGLYSFSGSLSVNESGSLSGTGTVNISTTTTNVNTLRYLLPHMKLNGDINNIVTNGKLFILNKNDPYVIAYLTSRFQRPLQNVTFSLKGSNNEYTDYTASDIFTLAGITGRSMYNGGYFLNAIESKLDLSNSYYGKQSYLKFSSDYFGSIIPLFVGYKSQMSNDIYRLIYGGDRIIDAINNLKDITENGNNNSQQKEQALNTQTTQMQNQMNQFQNIEDAAGDNMNIALNNINTNPSLLSTNKFLVSVDWIRQQYNRIVTNTPFEAVITFCLVFGLGLLLLGKVR